METVLKAIADWIKGILTAGIMSNLSGLFDAVNEQVGDIAQQVGTRPSAFEPRVFAMIESLSRNVVLPIAGIILTFIACYELIEMITQHNNMAQFEPALIMRWIFKTAVSVWFISNTFDIVMAVFDLTQKVVSDSSGIIAGNTRVNEIGLSMLEASLMQMDVGPLFGLFLQSFFIGITMRILSIVIFVIVYGRIIEIYCMVSLAPIPMATWGNHEQSHMGQNYLKCLFALGFQGFLILICVAIIDFPLELNDTSAAEYTALKEQYPDTLIGFEAGGNFMFYGEDAAKVAKIINSALFMRNTALGEVQITGFLPSLWAKRAKELWSAGNDVYLAGLNEDGTHHQTKHLRKEDYLPIGSVINMDDRKFRVDSVDFDKDKVSLQDMALADARMPIFREEPLTVVRELYEQQDEALDTAPEKTPDYNVGDSVVVDLPTRTIEGTIGYVGETDVRIDTSAQGYSWSNEVLNKQQFEDGLRQDEPELSDEELDKLPTSVEVNGEWQTFPDAAAADKALNAGPVPEAAGNFHITDDHLGEGGAKQKYARNVEAIRTLFQLEQEHRGATAEEQQILSQYVGWGGLPDVFDPDKGNWAKEYSELKGLLSEDEYAAARSSVLNAHYTSPTVIRAIYDAVEKMGFRNGNILEPSMGIGNFFGMLPDTMQDSRLYGVELDSVTGRIAQKLYPDANIKVAGFETTDRRDFYDLAVGNVPFGQYRVNDKAYNKLGFSIHNYFFAKAIDQVRPGGIVAFVTSRYTLDSKDSSARKHIAERADLLGAIRLPNTAFKANAGTEVVSDIIFLQKRDRPIDHEPDWVQLGKTEDGFAINSYFVDHPEMVLGELTSESTQYGREECTVRPIKGAVLVDQLAEAIQHIEGQFTEVEVETPDIADAENERHILPADPDVKNFSYTVVDGEVYYRENSVMTQVELSDTAKGRVTGMVELRQIVNELIDQQLNDYPDADIKATQEKLNTAYDAFSAKYGLLNDRKNGRLFEQDSSYYLLCSLENLDEQGRLKSKAAMFTKRTIRPECTVTNVDTPTEALAVSIGERGRVDLPYMAELLGTPGDYERITSELSGVIFKDPGADPTDPEAGWRMADEYLSGNVRAKLRMARLRRRSSSN